MKLLALLVLVGVMGTPQAASAQRLLNTNIGDVLGGVLGAPTLPPDQTLRTPLPAAKAAFAVASWSIDCTYQFISPAGGPIWSEAVSTMAVGPNQSNLFVEQLDEFLAFVMSEASTFCTGRPAQAGQAIFAMPAAFRIVATDCATCRDGFTAVFDPQIGQWRIFSNAYYLARR